MFCRIMILSVIIVIAFGSFNCCFGQLSQWKSKDDIKNAYKTLLNIQTGYDQDNVTFVSKVVSMGNEFKILRSERIKRLRCGYVYSALYHMRSSKIVMDTQGEKTTMLFLKMSTCITMYYEVVMEMLATMKNAKIKITNELWYLHMYINRTHFHVQMLFATTNVEDDTIKNVMLEHEFIDDRLQKFLMENRCNTANKFNHEYRESPFFGKLQAFNSCRQMKICQIDEVTALISENINMVKNLIDHNETVGGLSKNGHLSFKTEHLCLNNVMLKRKTKMRGIFEKLSPEMYWGGMLQKLKEANLKAQVVDIPSNGFADMAIYQTIFIDVLVIIELRIVWRHLKVVEEIGGLHMKHRPIFISKYREIIIKEITDFVVYTNQNKVIFFKNLIGLIGGLHITNISYKIEKLIAIIKDHMVSISKKFNISVLSDVDLESERTCLEFADKHKLKNVKQFRNDMKTAGLICGQVFLEYLKTIFPNVDFYVIRLFFNFAKIDNRLRVNFS